MVIIIIIQEMWFISEMIEARILWFLLFKECSLFSDMIEARILLIF